MYKNKTIATAESCTGGMLGSEFIGETGSSKWFSGGIICYSLETKVKFLEIDKAHAESVNCVSKQVAHEMAKGAVKLFGSEIGIGVTGYAEILQDNLQHAHYSIYDNITNISYDYECHPDFEQNRNEFRRYIVDDILCELATIYYTPNYLTT